MTNDTKTKTTKEMLEMLEDPRVIQLYTEMRAVARTYRTEIARLQTQMDELAHVDPDSPLKRAALALRFVLHGDHAGPIDGEHPGVRTRLGAFSESIGRMAGLLELTHRLGDAAAKEPGSLEEVRAKAGAVAPVIADGSRELGFQLFSRLLELESEDAEQRTKAAEAAERGGV